MIPYTGTFQLNRKEEFGGNKIYESYNDLEADFANKEVHPGDLKNSVGEAINKLLAPIIEKFESEEMKKLIEDAYPTAKAPVKQKKGKHSKI